MPTRHDTVTKARGAPKSGGFRGARLPVPSRSRRVERPAVTLEKDKRQSNLSLAVAAAKPDDRKSLKKAREALSCKKRPDSKKAARGSGGGRRFVPWC